MSRWRRCLTRIRKPLGELADDLVCVQADGFGIRADEGSAEDAGWPARHIVALERFEQRSTDLRVVGDGFEGDVTPLAFVAKAGPES